MAYSVAALMLPLRQREIADRAQLVRQRARVTVGAADVEAVRAMTTAFNSSDERLGGGHARSAVVEYLASDVAAYLDGSFSSDRIRKAMFAAAAQLAYLAGWKAHDLGKAALAQQYYLYSFQFTEIADPRAHAAYALRILAHQAMDLGRHEHCVDLADAALARARGRVDPETESLFWLTATRAHAQAGSPRPALVALKRAEKLIGKDSDDATPEWAALGGPAEARMTNQAGKALQALGDLPEAQEQLARSASWWNPITHPRIRALTLASLAETQSAQGKIDLACQTWNTALDGMYGIRSARTREAIDAMCVCLTPYRGRGIPAVERLLARVADMALPDSLV